MLGDYLQSSPSFQFRIQYDASLEEITLTSCSIPLISLHGCHVTTVEGLGDTRRGLHPVQVMGESVTSVLCSDLEK